MKAKLLRRIRRVFCSILPPTQNKIGWDISFMDEPVESTGQESSDLIKKMLLEDKPFLLTRFGSDVLMCAMDSTNNPTILNSIRYVLGRTEYLGWRPATIQLMDHNAGFFPSTPPNLSRYGKLIIEIMPSIDILASCMEQELFFEKRLRNSKKIWLNDIEPSRHKNPWTAALKGKRVLVIHPFEATIKHQYKNNRLNLYENPDILPEFELMTIKAVQTIAGNRLDDFKSWFEAYDFMKDRIDEFDFDIAILGCGSYGMPLAAYIKSKGKKAVHMGGSTQLLFGIIGKRWEGDPNIVRQINKYWIRPLPEDFPSDYISIEDGCYW